jgi:DNA-nicking Smr family endonuclease
MKLADLKTVHKELKERLLREAEAARLAKEAALKAKQDKASSHDLFLRAVGKVTVLPEATSQYQLLSKTPTIPVRAAPAQVPPERLEHEPLSDELDVERWLDTSGGINFRRFGVGEDVIRKLRRGVWRIQSTCDLHHLTSDEARGVLADHIQQGLQQGQRCIRVIHGQGYGSKGGAPVLKTKVLRWLVQLDAVTAFVQAKAEQGGAGALVVLLA